MEKCRKIASKSAKPIDCGWEEETSDEKKIVPVMCTLPCAPETVFRLIRCGCTVSKCSLACKCLSHSLRCTILCLCGGDEDQCVNYDLRWEDSEDDSDETLDG